jgi:hypothetical protein
MNQQDIAAALKRIAAPEPGPEAKLRAKRAALAELFLTTCSKFCGIDCVHPVTTLTGADP